MAKVAVDPEEFLKDCHLSPGESSFHLMSDGWKIHCETWTPSRPRAVLFHVHGLLESTFTLAVRRMAKKCLEHGIILEAMELHAHGLSLEKNGVKMPAPAMDKLESLSGTVGDHAAEMAKIVIKKHKDQRLPLIITGHSTGGAAIQMASSRISQACREAGMVFAAAVYIAPACRPTPVCCDLCCCYSNCFWFLCCQVCCGCVSFANDSNNKDGFNPGYVLGPTDRNPLKQHLASMYPIMSHPPLGFPTGKYLLKNGCLEADTRRKIFCPGKDAPVSISTAKMLSAAVPEIELEIIEGVDHDCLNSDPRSMEVIDMVFGYIEDALCDCEVASPPKQFPMLS